MEAILDGELALEVTLDMEVALDGAATRDMVARTLDGVTAMGATLVGEVV